MLDQLQQQLQQLTQEIPQLLLYQHLHLLDKLLGRYQNEASTYFTFCRKHLRLAGIPTRSPSPSPSIAPTQQSLQPISTKTPTIIPTTTHSMTQPPTPRVIPSTTPTSTPRTTLTSIGNCSHDPHYVHVRMGYFCCIFCFMPWLNLVHVYPIIFILYSIPSDTSFVLTVYW